MRRRICFHYLTLLTGFVIFLLFCVSLFMKSDCGNDISLSSKCNTKTNIKIKSLSTTSASVTLSPNLDIPKPETWHSIILKNLSDYEQTNSELITYIQKYYLTPPSTLPYTFELDDTQNGIVQVLWPILKRIGETPGKGFFVEAGAFDGVEASNTVWLEIFKGWTGLLVECHPQVVPILRKKNRKVYITDVCLSKYAHPAKAELTSVDGWHPSSSLSSNEKVFPSFAKNFTKFQVQTIPLYSLLTAIPGPVTEVDFISLDVQSLELEVLKHFPFDLILVKVWLVEFNLLSKDDQNELKTIMTRNKYADSIRLSGSDFLFLHESVKKRLFSSKNRKLYCVYFKCE